MQQGISYFAYGSNMSLPRLRARVPAARPVATGSLTGHHLRFHKRGRDGSAKCDAMATGREQDRLFGVLFTIPPEGKTTLDRIEGLGAGYDEKTVQIYTPDGSCRQAITYVATDINPELAPYWWYKHHVLAGARRFVLPPEHIASIANIAALPDPNPARRHRELAPYFS